MWNKISKLFAFTYETDCLKQCYNVFTIVETPQFVVNSLSNLCWWSRFQNEALIVHRSVSHDEDGFLMNVLKQMTRLIDILKDKKWCYETWNV